jgi:hypothetical protein
MHNIVMRTILPLLTRKDSIVLPRTPMQINDNTSYG